MLSELDRPILWRADIERVLAETHDQGLQALLLNHPDLVILADEDQAATIDLLRTIRGDERTRAVSIAIVRHEVRLEDEEELRRAGANVVFDGTLSPDLWDEWIEDLLSVPRRREARVPVEFSVWSQAAAGTKPAEGMSINISIGGMLIQAEEMVDVGSRLDLAFCLPGDTERVRAVGQVVRDEVTPGGTRFGINFLILRESAREKIRAFVEAAT
jgi:hypothetical protein